MPDYKDDPAFNLPLPSERALDEAARRYGYANWFAVPAWLRTAENRRVIVDARLIELRSSLTKDSTSG